MAVMEAIMGHISDFAVFQLWAQAIGFVGLGISILSFQFKGYRSLLFLRMLSEFVFGVQYLMLGAYPGMITNFASVGTNTVYQICNKYHKSTFVFRILFSLLFTGLCILTWTGPVTLLVIAAKIISTFANGAGKASTIRYCNIAVMILWLIYDSVVFTIGGILTNIVTLCSILVGILRYHKVFQKPNGREEKTT